ncbi:hypothetical protein KAR91_54865 [Candidatus Pacearchaeota archaeon]|nr:hypothetical protein [Candidatus Pacearchaeota archaeon]
MNSKQEGDHYELPFEQGTETVPANQGPRGRDGISSYHRSQHYHEARDGRSPGQYDSCPQHGQQGSQRRYMMKLLSAIQAASIALLVWAIFTHMNEVIKHVF